MERAAFVRREGDSVGWKEPNKSEKIREDNVVGYLTTFG